MKEIKPFVKLIPFIMLGMSFFASLISETKIYATMYLILSDLFGYSIFTSVFFIYFSHRCNMCDYVRIASWSLLMLNVLNIFSPLIANKYHWAYDTISSFLLFSLATFYYIKGHGRSRHPRQA